MGKAQRRAQAELQAALRDKLEDAQIDEIALATGEDEIEVATPEVEAVEAPEVKAPKAKAPATPKLTPAERKAARLAHEAEVRANGGVVFNAAGRPTARGLTCLCGCGEATHREDAWFRSGHDARLRKNVILNELTFSRLPEIVKPFFKLGAPIAGLQLAEDGETILDVKAGGGGLSEHQEFA